MLKRVQHDKKTQFAQRLCINEMLKRVTHDELFYFKSVSWICSARPYPPSAGREFRLSGFTTVGSICSLSGIHFIHSVRKSAKAIVTIFSLGVIEGIDVLSDVANGENFFKTTAKSATNLLGSITLSGYCGAIGSKMFGITGSMLGTGIGNLANNKLNNMLFD